MAGSAEQEAAGGESKLTTSPLAGLLGWVGRSLELREGLGASRLPVGYFANVIDLGRGQGLAISTDGVGTKLLVAQLMDRYDSIGIDCVAMNVNDVLCVGAEPLALVDYLAVERSDPALLEQIGRGLYEGARRANVAIVGGELAEVPSIVHGARAGFGFDLAATCVGLVELEAVIDGHDLQAGDLLIGLPSSGIHSNGLTLARRLLLDSGRYKVGSYVADLGRTVGEELLEPTTIYVTEILEVLRSGIDVHALAHLTGDGFLNLARVRAPLGYRLERLPTPHPIFELLRQVGGLDSSELYRTFNMGIGFTLAVPSDQADAALSILRRYHPRATVLGEARPDPERRIALEPLGVVLQ